MAAEERSTRLLRVGPSLLLPVRLSVPCGSKEVRATAWDVLAAEATTLVRAAGATRVKKLLRHPDVVLAVELLPSNGLRGALVSMPGRAGAAKLDGEFEFAGDAYAPFRVASEVLHAEARRPP